MQDSEESDDPVIGEYEIVAENGVISLVQTAFKPECLTLESSIFSLDSTNDELSLELNVDTTLCQFDPHSESSTCNSVREFKGKGESLNSGQYIIEFHHNSASASLTSVTKLYSLHSPEKQMATVDPPSQSSL